MSSDLVLPATASGTTGTAFSTATATRVSLPIWTNTLPWIKSSQQAHSGTAPASTGGLAEQLVEKGDALIEEYLHLLHLLDDSSERAVRPMAAVGDAASLARPSPHVGGGDRVCRLHLGAGRRSIVAGRGHHGTFADPLTASVSHGYKSRSWVNPQQHEGAVVVGFTGYAPGFPHVSQLKL